MPLGYSPFFPDGSDYDGLDDFFLNQNQDEDIFGLKTFKNTSTFDTGVGVPDLILKPKARPLSVITPGSVVFENEILSYRDDIDSWATQSYFNINAQRSTPRNSNIYLKVGDAFSLNNPYILNKDCILIGLGAQSKNIVNWDAEIHINKTLVSGATISVSSGFNFVFNLKVFFAAGSRLSFFCSGVGVSFPVIVATFIYI
jgi:hypothetical protein